MEQLKKAYEAIEMLRALELPVSDEQLRAIAKLEKEYLQNEIIPLLKQELEPFVTKLRSKLQMEVTFDKDEGFNMQLVEQTERKQTSINKDADSVPTRDTSKYSIDGGEPLKKRRFVQPDLIKRFFLEPEDLITLSDGTRLTVYNQWGQHFANFLEVAQRLHEVECFSSNN